MKISQKILFALGFLIIMNFSTFSQQPPIESGVPLALAQWRAKHYSDIRYKLNLRLEKGAPLMKGDIEIRVNLTEEGAKNDLILDWRTTQFENDKDKPFANVTSLNGQIPLVINVAEHLRISRQFLKVGENIIKIEFASPIKTSGSAITRYIDKEDGSEYIYSLFVPSDASTAFPVFDQPDLKARFQLNVGVPYSWRVVTNTNLKSMQAFSKDYYYFEETKPISTYVFAFAAGNFEEIDCRDDSCGRPMSGAKTNVDNKSTSTSDIRRFGQAQDLPLQSKIYVRKSQSNKLKQHSAEVFRINRESIKYFEEYFDYKFPFPKYDLVLIPEFPFGGMEHAGATFLRESSIIFPSEPTKNDLISRATLIFHENAHQWFGDLVTMKWFDDLWLKEGFATFMGFKALDKIMPEMNAWKAFYERNKVAAYQTDSTKGTTPIYQEISNLSAAKSAYGAIVYSKAPSFLKQDEFYLGEKEFQTAVRSFLKKHEFSNATWQDLVTEFEIASKKDLKDWANNWVTKRGVPLILTRRKESERGVLIGYEFIQIDPIAESNGWYLKSKLLEAFSNGTRGDSQIYFDSLIPRNELDKNVKDYRVTSALSLGITHESRKANFLFPNYQDYGYGIFLLDEKSRDYILANVQNEKDDFLRAMMYGSLWDSVREAELNPKDYVELVIKNVAAEKDETIVSSMLGRANTAMNYYLDDKTRESLAPKLEEILINKMQSAETLGQRITFYRSFLNVASSEKARQVLKDVLSGKIKIEGFNCRGDSCVRPMSEAKTKVDNKSTSASDIRRSGQAQDQPLQTILKTKDKFDIVTKLFILGDKDAENLLSELTKTDTSDDAKRYAYAARAGIATAENKAKYWNDFVNNKEISESWIESAFVSFNSNRHSNLTQQFLEKALAELPNHKKNRKIFFVNGWLGAFIGGQKSEESLNIVNKFLADNPNLDRDLRLKILENADVIERAVKIRQKFGN